MEGFGVSQMIEELSNQNIKITRIIHNKDSSTLNHVISVYQDVEEALCTSIFYYINI